MARLIADARVRERFGKSQRTIDRWSQDPELGFPRPIYIRGRKHRDADAIDQFEAKLIASAEVGRGLGDR
jgi:hypothetical protein